MLAFAARNLASAWRFRLMVAGQHKLSRRALLAGACVAPVLDASVLLGSAPRRDPAWEKAVARLARAEEAIGALADSADERAYDRAVGRQIAALPRVLKALAPDLGAVGAKIGLIPRHQAWELRFGEAAFAALEKDVRRLAAA
ncbi:MAG TPA: hypothetical protein VF680_08050 [Allosphingosinicella sp.]|jgi:hypothetical protein